MAKLIRVLISLFGARLASNAFAAGIATTASLFLRADPLNYVGYNLPPEGTSFIQTPDSSTAFRSYLSGPLETTFYSSGNTNFSLAFTAPKYSVVDNKVMPRQLTVGLYDNARRVMSAPELAPGMDVSGFARGYNRLSGWFNVLDVSYASSGEIVSLAVDFAEYGENLTKSGPGLYGSFRYNSLVPLNTSIPEPGSLSLYLLGFAGLLQQLRCRTARKQRHISQ